MVNIILKIVFDYLSIDQECFYFGAFHTSSAPCDVIRTTSKGLLYLDLNFFQSRVKRVLPFALFRMYEI